MRIRGPGLRAEDFPVRYSEVSLWEGESIRRSSIWGRRPAGHKDPSGPSRGGRDGGHLVGAYGGQWAVRPCPWNPNPMEEVVGWIAFFATPLMGQDLQLATRRRYMIGRLLRKHYQFQELTCRLWGATMDPKVDGVADAPIRVGSTRGGRGGAR